MKALAVPTNARLRMLQTSLAAALLVTGFPGSHTAFAEEDGDSYFQPGNLLVSRVVYDNKSSNIKAGVTLLPPNCIRPDLYPCDLRRLVPGRMEQFDW